MFEYITNLLEGHVVPSLKLAVQQNDKAAIAECSGIMRRCSDVMLNINFDVERVLSSLTYTNTPADVCIRELARCKCIVLYIEEGVTKFTVRNEYTPHNELVGIELQWAEDDEEKFMVLYKNGEVTEMPVAFKPIPSDAAPQYTRATETSLGGDAFPYGLKRAFQQSEKETNGVENITLNKVMPVHSLDKSQMSVVRYNLLSDVHYRPYCGNPSNCSMPRTVWTGEQFKCPYCNWVSGFEPEFIALYKTTHMIK